MNVGLQLRLLGTPEVTIDQNSVIEGLSGKAQAALYYLAVTGQTHTRPALAGLLWGDLPEAAARANLRRVLVDLRQSVGDYLEIERQTVGFAAGREVWADVVDLTSGIGEASSPVNVDRLQQAVALYRGDFLAGFYVRDAPDFESWAAAERERLRELVIQALYTLADHHTQQAEWTEGITATRRVLALEPWREEAHRQLMLLLARSGQRSAALAQFETCRQILEEELGVDPGAETKRLYERIRDEDLSSAGKFGAEEVLAEIQARWAGFANADEDLLTLTPSLARLPSPTGRGDRREGGEGYFQKSTSEISPAPPHTLRVPSSPTPLIGREKELADINDLLADPDCRLLTLVGPGGIGKTRLAIEAARQALAQFDDGIYFVSLATTDSLEDILPRIATAVDPETYPTGHTAADFLPRLQQRDPAMLLVLDNLEQLLPGGNAAIENLLTQTQRLKLIVTSREALIIRWEWHYNLDGLAYPPSDTADALESYSAVEMFLQRLRQTRREVLTEVEVQAAAQICRLVGGMPLGIELAAAQASRLPITAIVKALARNLDALVVSLRDLPERQRNLRASFEVTWANLSPDEQAVFRRLSLFRSSFSAEAAQAVAETGPLSLINLIDKSLLRQVSPERYDIHQVLRHFAQEKLAENPAEQAQTLKRYRDYYTAFLHERNEAFKQATDLTKELTEVFAEIDNLWTGWARIMRQDDAQGFASALVGALHAIPAARFELSPDSLLVVEHQQQLLERHSSEVDVSLIDLIWTDPLADHLLDLSQDLENELQSYFSLYIENNTVAGRLVALPYMADVGMLFYRADLLAKYGFAEPPVTWDELEVMAAEIQAGERAAGHKAFWGFVWQGQNYEGLTCNALEWQISHGGGRLIEPEGVITVNNPQTVAAFKRAVRWIGTISPVTVTEPGSGNEMFSFNDWNEWVAGNVMFMRNWVGFSGERVDNLKGKGQLGLTRLPSGGASSAATLGGQQIAISKYARHPRAAIELVRYATSLKAQLQRVISWPYWPPTISALYDHPQVVAAHPYMPKLKEMFSSGNLVARPSKVCGKLYPQVSKAYSTAVHSILTGQVEAATAVAELEARLVEITGFRVGRP